MERPRSKTCLFSGASSLPVSQPRCERRQDALPEVKCTCQCQIGVDSGVLRDPQAEQHTE